MELFENKVGRPSNEIIKKRRMFIASIVLVVAVVLFAGCYALFSVGTNDLSGASSGRNYIDMSVRNSKVKVNGCKITIPVDIKNAQKKELTFLKAQIYYVGGKPLQTIKFNRTLAAKTKITENFVFDINKFTDINRGDYKVTLIFKVSGKSKEYYEYDLYTVGTGIFNSIKNCKSNGWKKENGNWYYYESNKKVTGWKKLTWEGKNSWFYFESNGKMVTGWKEIKWSGANRWFYFDSKGRMATGWVKLKWKGGTDWFYFDPTDGYCYQDVCKTIDGKQYCFDKDGVWKDGNSNPNTTKSTNLKCTSSMGSVGSGNISCTTVAGAVIDVLGQSPVVFMKSFTADSNGKISIAVLEEGSYSVISSKSGYTSTNQIIKVTRKKTLSQGDKVTLNGYYYSSARAKKAATKSKKTGTFYVSSATIINDRIRIVKNKKDVGNMKKVIAWVNVDDLTW